MKPFFLQKYDIVMEWDYLQFYFFLAREETQQRRNKKMTIVIGLVDTYKRVHLACDSSATDMEGESIESIQNQKIFKKGEYIMGVSGSFRIMDIVRYLFEPPSFNYRPSEHNDFDGEYQPEREKIYEGENFLKMNKAKFMVQFFIPKLIKCLNNNKCLKNMENVVSMDGSILVGFEENLFCIDSDFQVGCCGTDNFMVIGCAGDPAKGSLLNSYYNWQDPCESLMLALTASSKYSKNVKGPFYSMCNDTYQLKNINV
jgi:hypothetical protein